MVNFSEQSGLIHYILDVDLIEFTFIIHSANVDLVRLSMHNNPKLPFVAIYERLTNLEYIYEVFGFY